MNTDKTIQSIIDHEARRPGLFGDEKAALRRAIMTRAARAVASPYAKHWTFALRLAVACCGVFFICMTTATYASAAALPGDFLYRFKVEVREPLIALTKGKDAAQTYAVNRVAERYREIAVLAQDNKLTAASGAEALTYLKTQTEAVAANTAKEKPATTDTAAVTTYLKKTRDISSTIAAHSQVLTNVQAVAAADTTANNDATTVIHEAQTIAAESVGTIAASNHDVIASIPADDKTATLAAVSDLENEVQTLPDIHTASTSASAADKASIDETTKTQSVDAATDQAATVDTTLSQIDALLGQLDAVLTDTKNTAVLKAVDEDGNTIQDLYDEAKEAKKNGDYATALELLHKALEEQETAQKAAALQQEITPEAVSNVTASASKTVQSSISASSTISSVGSISSASALK